MQLPEFDKLQANHPDYKAYPPPESVKRLIGGEVLDKDVTNTCSIRMTHKPALDVAKRAGDPFDRAPIDGATGIIAFDIGFRDATGHFDLWYGDHFSHEGGAGRGYFATATRATLWSGDVRRSIAPV